MRGTDTNDALWNHFINNKQYNCDWQHCGWTGIKQKWWKMPFEGSAILWGGHLMANQEPTEAADATYLKKEISAFRHSVLNYIYLTFLVPFQLKFVIFYEWDVYFGTLARCWKF